jgi:hypothetical protein
MLDPVLFDVDSVCNHFMNPLLDAVRAYLVQDGNKVEAEKVPDKSAMKSFTMSDHLTAEAWATARYILSTDPSWWGRLPPNENAQEAVELVRRAGYQVRFVTSPWDSLPTWWHVRKQWLDLHFGAKRIEFAPVPDKSIVRGARLYEDNVDNLDAWNKRNAHKPEAKGILIAQPWNDVERPNRFTWEEALAELRDWLKG